MAYATYGDICERKDMTEIDKERIETLLEDAAVIIDVYNKSASDTAKRFVSCNMVIRAIGSSNEGVPIGTTQATLSALGYSQSWTNSNGSGELYLSKMDKKVLGIGGKVGCTNPYAVSAEMEED